MIGSTEKQPFDQPLEAEWFAEYMEELPEVKLLDDIPTWTNVVIVLSIAAAVIVPIAVFPMINYVSLIVLAAGLGLLSLFRLSSSKRMPRDAAIVVLLIIFAVFIVHQANGRAPCFIVLVAILIAVICEFESSVLRDFIAWICDALNLPDAERTFYTEVFLSRDTPLSRRRINWLISLVGDSQNAHVRKNAMARVYDTLREANRSASIRAGAPELMLLCLYALALALSGVLFSLSYFTPQFFLYYAGLIYFFVQLARAPVPSAPPELHVHTRDAAIRHWFAKDDSRTLGYLCIVALATVLFARSSNYFPIATFELRQAATSYLESEGHGHSSNEAAAFLAAKPENWIVANWHAIQAGQVYKLLVFVPNLGFCYFAPKLFADLIITSLIQPTVWSYRLSIAYAEEMRRYGVVRDLDEYDMVEPYVNAPYEKGTEL